MVIARYQQGEPHDGKNHPQPEKYAHLLTHRLESIARRHGQAIGLPVSGDGVEGRLWGPLVSHVRIEQAGPIGEASIRLARLYGLAGSRQQGEKCYGAHRSYTPESGGYDDTSINGVINPEFHDEEGEPWDCDYGFPDETEDDDEEADEG